MLEKRDLAGHSHDRLPCSRRSRRPPAHDEHLPELLLEALEALTHRRRGDMQRTCGRVETALINDRRDGRGQLRRDAIHVSHANGA
jgi:hypothetical protein